MCILFFFHELMQLIYINLCFSDLRGKACFLCVALGTNLALEESQRAHDPKRFMPKLSCKERGSRVGFLEADQNPKLLNSRHAV